MKSARSYQFGGRLIAAAALTTGSLGIVVLGTVASLSGVAEAALRLATGVAVSFDASASVLTVTSDGQHFVDLHHNDKTQNVAAVDPTGFPPGPCKRLALRWNDAVAGGAAPSEFRVLLGGMATKGCTVGYLADDAGAPAGGPLHLVSVAPAKP